MDAVRRLQLAMQAWEPVDGRFYMPHNAWLPPREATRFLLLRKEVHEAR